MSKQPAIIVDNVSMKFNLSKEKVDSLKDYIIKSIKKEIKYNEFWALQNVSFTVEKGDRVGILGLNGAGKSTLLKVIAGVFKPTEGSVTKHGKMVPLLELGAGFDQQYTGKENIYLYGAMLGYSKEFIDEKYDEIVKFSELKDFIDVPIKNYSSGMKSRLGFSIATVVSPKILILDEVLSVGDAKFRKKSEKKVLSMFDSGVTVLFVGVETSDDAAIYKISDETAMIQTLDFFTPVVDDPYLFGQIAAANSLSDVYAMGGEPKVALNIVCFPNCLDPEILGEILRFIRITGVSREMCWF